MRKELIEEMLKDVLGPRGGATEEISADPLNEYITGVLIPQKCKKGDEENPDSEQVENKGEDSSADDDTNEEEGPVVAPSELDPKMRPRVFGISFVVRGEKPSFRVCATWGRYFMEGKENWKRKPYFNVLPIDMSDKEEDTFEIYRGDDGSISLYVRKLPKDDGHTTIIVNMLNNLDIDSKKCYGRQLTEASLFQPSIRIRIDDHLQLATFQIAELKGNEDLQFLYRNNPIRARGHMCSAIWDGIDYPDYLQREVFWPDGEYFTQCKDFIKPHVRSEFVPLYPDPAPLLEWDEDNYGKLWLSAHELSEIWDDKEIEDSLSPLIKAYESWIGNNKKIIESDKGLEGSWATVASSLIELQEEASKRLKAGLEILKKEEDARLAFCFANRVIWLQNYWRGRKDFEWKPFQLAFLILSLESIYNRNSEYRDCADLLWIPTGGGKTEAYLAIMAFTIALRRRRAKKDLENEKTGGGTTVITRYTLRLLTTQQFRRTLRMITAAEYLRVGNWQGYTGWRPKKCNIKEDWLYGSMRFSTGLWVGSSVTPNHLRKKNYSAIDALRGDEDVEGDPAQVTTCPACGEWLAVPGSGLPEGKNKLNLVVKTDKKSEEIRKEILSLTDQFGYLEDVEISDKNHLGGYRTLVISLRSNEQIKEKEIDSLGEKIENELQIENLPFRASRPGYFGYGSEPGRRKGDVLDFEIICPGQNCPLGNNVSHGEGVPYIPDPEAEPLPDGLYPRKTDLPFLFGSRIPIPACTVDEQVYHQCPSVVVSTADKIARMAFEPRAGLILGNVEGFNSYYGYYRDDLFPDFVTKKGKENCNVSVNSFLPPELILQDELHLLEGPLGSIFGLYENVVEGLMEDMGSKPKYIASTATIKEGSSQVRQLFAKNVFQFPPHGIDIDDNFFVRTPEWEEGWNEEKPGRVYMGIYSPGWGPHTPNVRIWSRLLETCNRYKNDDFIKYFWTLVGYFNSIRELGGTRGLYREDIVERLGDISPKPRQIDQSNVVELSSRRKSTDIPQILDELERGEKKPLEENPDAIFTSSMFGTGVDIPHLSLMLVNGQPKTTTQYVQATGRVGRRHGALVVTFLRAGRPRDLSHYEMFPGYHQRKHLEVEPSSVFPFATGCLDRACGPTMVSFLRNMSDPSVKWYEEDGTVILGNGSTDDIMNFKEVISSRVKSISDDLAAKVLKYIDGQKDMWENKAKLLTSNKTGLVFNEPTFYRPPEKNVVLGDPQHHKAKDLKVVYKNAPQSLREIEETTGFEV